ncbi:thioesterase-like superfamily-domain-containing protein [Stachybotrys elegans]|uniref:Thioesterase-like superfamily-domain-containing protein n=1 Tax=Stachybotrys elegans TaxID=80388 RepID=A0A8K0SQC3_9HYPO|nr:thioesterase-like superfamily-domain-containing protein [Stachybotrys elegans]
MTPLITELIAVEPAGPGEFVSKVLPIRLGNAMPIAYGGCSIAAAVNAAYQTVPANVSLYSLVGHYLGPASTEQKLYCTVHQTRNTRSFATRRVEVKQKAKDGKFRACLELIADFHVREPSSIEYMAAPVTTYAPPDDCPDLKVRVADLLSRGLVTEKQRASFEASLGPMGELFETRYCVNSISGQNLSGVAKNISTSQDNRAATDKTSAEWQRCREILKTPAEQMAALAFLMDGALAFVPLTHNHLWFEDVEACSSLDFALRIFTPDIDVNQWTLRERVALRSGSGRSYAEGRLWDTQGNLLASMTQQSIIRLKANAKANL